MLYIRITALLLAVITVSSGLSRRAMGDNPHVKADAAPRAIAASDTAAKVITVKDIDGKDRRPLATGDAKAAVVFFLTHDCPISNGYSPEINRICQAFGGAGKVSFHIVHPYVELDPQEARKHAKEYGYTVPIIVDTQRQVTRAVKAKVTPEAVVVSPTGEVIYRGRIDDTWTDYGKRRPAATVHDLRDALSAVLAGKPVPVPVTEAIGCPIEE